MIADPPHQPHSGLRGAPGANAHPNSPMVHHAPASPGLEAFDALADLFLGDMNAVASHDAAMGLTPSGRSSSSVRDDAPGCPQPAEPAPPNRLGRPDVQRRLSLVREQPAPVEEPTPAPPPAGLSQAPCVEALVLGHLPVMASAWANQYVRHVADKLQSPVALIRISGRTLRIELHTPAGSPPAADAGAGLDGAISTVQTRARRVVVVSDRSAELDAAALPGVGRITLLSSGDEAGVVAAYGLIKSLAKRLSDRSGTKGSPPIDAMLRVAVMGAPPSRAEYVLGRLQQAARTFLGMALQSDACIARIGSGPLAQPLYAGPLDVPAEDLVAMLAVGSAGSGQPAKPLGADPSRSEPTPARPTPPSPTAPMHQPRTPSRHAPMPIPQAHPFPSAEFDHLDDRAPRGSLTIHLPGHAALEVRCPAAPEVELALDDDGILHALARAETHPEPARALHRVMIAAAWAEANRAVLELTLPPGGARRIARLAPMMHIFTDQPKVWRGLLEGPVRLHLLAVVDPQTDPDWVCAPLN